MRVGQDNLTRFPHGLERFPPFRDLLRGGVFGEVR